MNLPTRLAKVAAAIAPRRWTGKPFDVQSATDEELLVICAGDDEMAELLRRCFAEHPAGTLFGRTWPDRTQPGRRCGLSAYLHNHPEFGPQADAIIDRLVAGGD